MEHAFGPGTAYDAIPALPVLRRTFTLTEEGFHALHTIQVAVEEATGERLTMEQTLHGVLVAAASPFHGDDDGENAGGEK